MVNKFCVFIFWLVNLTTITISICRISGRFLRFSLPEYQVTWQVFQAGRVPVSSSSPSWVSSTRTFFWWVVTSYISEATLQRRFCILWLNVFELILELLCEILSGCNSLYLFTFNTEWYKLYARWWCWIIFAFYWIWTPLE